MKQPLTPLDAAVAEATRRYEEGTMVLATHIDMPAGSIVMHDFFADHLARLVRCERGKVALRVEVTPRFDHGVTLPDLRHAGSGLYPACGSTKACSSTALARSSCAARNGALWAETRLQSGEEMQPSVRYVQPEALWEAVLKWNPACAALPKQLDRTLAWWAAWERSAGRSPHPDPLTRGSALVQLMYGLDGRGRLPAMTLSHLEGWRGARPVRIGNAAAGQSQLDAYCTLLELACLAHERPADEPCWDFLVEAVNSQRMLKSP